MRKMIYIFLLGSIGMTSLEGCKKEIEKNEKINQIPSLEKIKLLKIERFISIMWAVPAEDISYNDDLKIFTFKDVKITKMQIELIYDRANEYKFKNER